MRSVHFLLVAFFALSACTTSTPYPYAPQYASSKTVHARSIPAPPAPYSAEWKRDLEEVITLQKNVTPAIVDDIKKTWYQKLSRNPY
jgi:hypothetical protein